MKKFIAFAFILLCILSAVGCSKDPIDTTKPVFETENITRITLFSVPHHPDGVEVPHVYMDEITAWIGTFTIGKVVDGLLDPGTNTTSFRLEYADGTIIESGVNTITIDGITYSMKQDSPPKCFHILLANNEILNGTLDGGADIGLDATP